MGIITTEKQGNCLNTLERYHIYRISKCRLCMDDTYIDTPNLMFGTLQEINT